MTCLVIAMVENPISVGRTNHINVRHHLIRELLERRVLGVDFTGSSSQHTDILTKPLGLEGFVKHRTFLVNLLFFVQVYSSKSILAGRALTPESQVFISSFLLSIV